MSKQSRALVSSESGGTPGYPAGAEYLQGTDRRAFGPALVAMGTALLVFFVLPPLSKSGLWDPFELNVADLSRRIALNLYHASNLALEGADNSLPHLNDLGRPQLPFSSIALGFKLFGLHEWAGRLPLAIWGVAGVVATFAFVARLFDKRSAAYAAVILTTTPLYFVQARTMLGDVCAMAGFAMAFGGFAVAVFGASVSEGKSRDSWMSRVGWVALGAAGLFVGFETRGGILGMAVPLLGVGLSWAVVRAGSRAGLDRTADVVGMVCLSGGIGAAWMGVTALSQSSRDLNLWIGAMIHVPSKYPTFDFYIATIGHSMAPWSAFLPFAAGRLLFVPPPGSPSERERQSLGRAAVLVGVTVAFSAHAFLADKIDLVPFTAPALCAVICAVAIRDFELGADPSVAVAVGTLVVAAVLHHDFHELPDKAYQAFGIATAQFPEGFKARSLSIWWAVLGGFAVCSFLTWVELDPGREPFAPANYSKPVKVVRSQFDGAVAVTYLALATSAILAAIVLLVGVRSHWRWTTTMPSLGRDAVLNAWWVVTFGPPAAIFALIFACDIWLWSFGKSAAPTRSRLLRGFEPFEDLFNRLTRIPAQIVARDEDVWVVPLVLLPMFAAILLVVWIAATSLGASTLMAAAFAVPAPLVMFLVLGIAGDLVRHRAAGFVLGGGLTGFLLCFAYYPALANQLSPKDVFESYRRVCPNAPLALLGVGGRTSAYYAGGQPQSFSDPSSAYRWLAAGTQQRRCLALKVEELPKVNQLWREGSGETRANLPIVDARSSQILLAASSLSPGDHDDNPLSSMVLYGPVHPQRQVEANLEDKIEVLGIDVVDDRNREVDVVSPRRTYHIKTYYKVLAPVTTEWEEFIHIDGYQKRHNGDHKPLNGKYPMALWLPGDELVDDYEFTLEPNFTPGNKYTIYLGLFVGETRLKVVSGPSDGDNRVNAGALRIQ